jgi:hypothetical protein
MKDKKYVCLEGIRNGNKFYTSNKPRPEYMANGKLAYRILGYADTEEGALQILYTTPESLSTALYDYLKKTISNVL